MWTRIGLWIVLSVMLLAGDAVAREGTFLGEPVIYDRWIYNIKISGGGHPSNPLFVQGQVDNCGRYSIVGSPKVIYPYRDVDNRLRYDSIIVEVPLRRNVFCIPGPRLPRPYVLNLGTIGGGSRLAGSDFLIILTGRDVEDPEKLIIVPESVEPPFLLAEFSVLGKTLPANASGMWGDPNRPGEGVNVMALDDGVVFVYFGQDSQGNPLWLLSEVIPYDGPQEPPFDRLQEGRLFKVKGGSFEVPSSDLEQWGLIRYRSLLSYSYCGQTLSFELVQNDAVVKEMSLVRIAAPRSQPDCGEVRN